VSTRRLTAGWLVVGLVWTCAPLHADEPPRFEHQPIPCTVPPCRSLCAPSSVTTTLSRKLRYFFRPAREKYFTMAKMAFGGLNYCATLPAPRDGKLREIEYYLQAVDSGVNFERTPTYRILVQSEGECSFPPVEKNAERAAAIVVHATMKKQGGKLHGAFDRQGVTFVPSNTK